MWNYPRILAIVFLGHCLKVNGLMVKPENSLFGPFVAGGDNLNWWTLMESAQLADTALRLTTDEPEKHGSIWNTHPVLSNDWEFHMQFHIHGKGVHMNGDGLAFWYVRDPLFTGPVFGSKDNFVGLGVFIDTHTNPDKPHNHNHPYISAVVNNGSQLYEHDEDGTANQIGSCSVPLRNLEWPTKIAFSYIRQVFSIFMDVEGKGQWSECFRAAGVHLPTGYFFGLSASTGMLSDNHDIISITALDMNLPDVAFEDKSFIVPHAEFVQVPPKPHAHNLEDTLQEILQKIDTKPEVHEHVIKIEEPLRPEVRAEEHEPETGGVRAEQPPPHLQPPQESASFTTKVIYIAGIGLLLVVGISQFRKYYAQRKERIQKRLY